MMKKDYSDIIGLEHPTSTRHKKMTKMARAAQFAPFAALTGFEDATKETARLTDEKIELDENKKEILDEKLQFLRQNRTITVSIMYFKPDGKKNGGSYQTITDVVNQVDIYNRSIVMGNGTKIELDSILDIQI